jgi:hypothetical protein
VSFRRSSTSSALHFQDTPRTRLSDIVRRQACAGLQYRTLPVSRWMPSSVSQP